MGKFKEENSLKTYKSMRGAMKAAQGRPFVKVGDTYLIGAIDANTTIEIFKPDAMGAEGVISVGNLDRLGNANHCTPIIHCKMGSYIFNSNLISQTDENIREEVVKGSIKNMIDAMNYSGCSVSSKGQLISRTISEEHRTLQQAFWRVINEAIEHYSTIDSYDDRNKGSVHWARMVSKLQSHFPYI